MDFETVLSINNTATMLSAMMINLLFVVTTIIDKNAQSIEKLANNKTSLS